MRAQLERDGCGKKDGRRETNERLNKCRGAILGEVFSHFQAQSEVEFLLEMKRLGEIHSLEAGFGDREEGGVEVRALQPENPLRSKLLKNRQPGAQPTADVYHTVTAKQLSHNRDYDPRRSMLPFQSRNIKTAIVCAISCHSHRV